MPDLSAISIHNFPLPALCTSVALVDEGPRSKQSEDLRTRMVRQLSCTDDLPDSSRMVIPFKVLPGN